MDDTLAQVLFLVRPYVVPSRPTIEQGPASGGATMADPPQPSAAIHPVHAPTSTRQPGAGRDGHGSAADPAQQHSSLHLGLRGGTTDARQSSSSPDVLLLATGHGAIHIELVGPLGAAVQQAAGAPPPG